MTPDPLRPIGALVKAWSASATICLRHAHSPDNGLSPQAKAVFAGRADGYQNCADTLRLIIGLIRGPATEALQSELDEALATVEKNIDP